MTVTVVLKHNCQLSQGLDAVQHSQHNEKHNKTIPFISWRCNRVYGLYDTLTHRAFS